MGPVWSAFVGYLVAFAGTVLASLVAAWLLLAAMPDVAATRVIESLPGLIAGGLASSSALAAVAVFMTRPPRPPGLGLVRSRASRSVVLLMVIGVLALGQALESLSFVLGVGSRGAVETIRRAIAGASGARLALAVLTIGVVAGVAEELFFRGFMQTRLRQRWPAHWAVIVTAACFGALHLDWIHGVLAFALGLYLGWVVEQSGSVKPAVLCHVVNNSTAIVLTAVFEPVTYVGANLGLFVLMMLVFAATVGAVQILLPARRVGTSGPVRVG
jgi:hypothetical protein